MKKTSILIFALICCITTFAQRYTGKNNISPQEKLNNEYCTGLFKAYDGTIIDLLNDNESANSYLNILDWLQGRIAGLQIYYTRFGTPVPFIRNSRASLFVDEIPVDPGFLKMLPVSDIAMVKIIKQPFAGAIGNGGGGTIAIYTIKGDDEEEEEIKPEK
ncbi:MAG TPA: hypothetical protein VGQ09_18625 [Chitinophagaceae bacterium]|jgi:hypothetical protein|nr:hypothetical protein [Chitinophagaceae bacterium]